MLHPTKEKMSTNTKAQTAEKKGDAHAQKGAHKKAVEHYKKAVEQTPDNLSLYDKLISSHKQIEAEWTDEDFTLSLEWTMKKQELENPGIKRIHARLSEEGREISKIVGQLMQAPNDDLEAQAMERIAAYGTKAVYPLLDVILTFKEIQKKIAGQK
jgi:hypothetical protein